MIIEEGDVIIVPHPKYKNVSNTLGLEELQEMIDICIARDKNLFKYACAACNDFVFLDDLIGNCCSECRKKESHMK